jgi:hypothetical protein
MIINRLLGWHLKLFSAILLGITIINCNKLNNDSEKFNYLFKGFRLLLVDRIDVNKSKLDIISIDPTELKAVEPKIGGFESGKIYLFMKECSTHNEKLGVSLFPKKLKIIGATSIDGPRSAGEMIHVYVGDPLYGIAFEYNGKHCNLFNKNYYNKDKDAMDSYLLLACR